MAYTQSGKEKNFSFSANHLHTESSQDGHFSMECQLLCSKLECEGNDLQPEQIIIRIRFGTKFCGDLQAEAECVQSRPNRKNCVKIVTSLFTRTHIEFQVDLHPAHDHIINSF